MVVVEMRTRLTIVTGCQLASSEKFPDFQEVSRFSKFSRMFQSHPVSGFEKYIGDNIKNILR